MDVNAVRDALGALFSVHTYTAATASMASPCVVVSFPQVTFDRTLGGTGFLEFTVSIGTSIASEKSAEEFLGDQVSAVRDTVQVPNALWRSAQVIQTFKPYNTEVGQSTFKFVDVTVHIYA